MSKLLRYCFCFTDENDDVKSITDSFTGTLHSYTNRMCENTNFEDMISMMKDSKSVQFVPTNEDIVERYLTARKTIDYGSPLPNK